VIRDSWFNVTFSHREYDCCEYPTSNSFPILQVTVWTLCKCLAPPTKTSGPDPELRLDPELRPRLKLGLGLRIRLLDNLNKFKFCDLRF
jgi:hypothetical protein